MLSISQPRLNISKNPSVKRWPQGQPSPLKWSEKKLKPGLDGYLFKSSRFRTVVFLNPSTLDCVFKYLRSFSQISPSIS